MRRRLPWLRRRRACAALAPTLGAATQVHRLSIGTTPVFLDDDVAFLRDWQAYLQRELGRPVAFVQRRSYREVSELLMAEKLDAAWICGFPYVRYRDRMRLLAVPDVRRGAVVPLVRDRAEAAIKRRSRSPTSAERSMRSRTPTRIRAGSCPIHCSFRLGKDRGDVLPQDVLHVGPSPGSRCGRRRAGAGRLGRWLCLGHAASFTIRRSPSRRVLRTVLPNTASLRS